MIDRICIDLETKAKTDHHHIGKGFQDALILGKVKMLRMDCQQCDFFIVVDPETGKYVQSFNGPCKMEMENKT
jgi:hypothetical protein